MPNTSSSTPVYYPKDGLKSDIHPARLYIKKTGFPKYVMVSGGVSKLGKTPLLFVESGTKINGEHYQELLNQMLPACRALANEQPFIFQQDGSRSHTSASTLAYFAEHADDCELLPPSKWPAKSPDLNPCDYSIWNELNASLHKRMQFENVEEMKAHLLRVWDQLPQQHIDNCINSFRKRCRHVIEVDGYNIDHMN